MDNLERYFFHIAYNGTNYSGWQRQNNAPTVQETIEVQLKRICRQHIGIMGCGRTDAGVHASQFFFHCDLPNDVPKENLCFKLNSMVPADIVLYDMIKVEPNAHARFDATKRSYIYNLSLRKNPFKETFHYFKGNLFDLNKINEVAKILTEYKAFYPFCKAHSDVNNYNCDLSICEWKQTSAYDFELHVSSNRFLRGMIRLIVGMCLNYLEDKITLEEIHHALQNQTRLKRDLSVSGRGLFLSEVVYDYI